MKHRVADRGAFSLVGLQGRFTKETTSEFGPLWGRFMPRVHEIAGRREMPTYGVCRKSTSPGTSEEAFEYTAAVEVTGRAPAPSGMARLEIPAARYAVFTHEGHVQRIGETWDAIFHEGLAQAGLKHAEGYDFETYDPRWDAKSMTGPVDIWIAVRR